VSGQAKKNKRGFDQEVVGRQAECDGGRPLEGTRFATREEFTGTLSGDYIDYGDPPWRWYLMAELTVKPPSYAQDSVWCEANSIFFVDEQASWSR